METTKNEAMVKKMKAMEKMMLAIGGNVAPVPFAVAVDNESAGVNFIKALMPTFFCCCKNAEKLILALKMPVF